MSTATRLLRKPLFALAVVSPVLLVYTDQAMRCSGVILSRRPSNAPNRALLSDAPARRAVFATSPMLPDLSNNADLENLIEQARNFYMEDMETIPPKVMELEKELIPRSWRA
jgi:hypothetical protein